MHEVEDIYELSPIQQGILFHNLLTPGSGLYFVQSTLVLHGELDWEAFERAWQRVVQRHPILRSSFHWRDLDKPLQVVHRQAKLDLEQEDWRALSAAEQHQRMQDFLRADRSRGFDFSQPPLMRLFITRSADRQYDLIWSFHHILMDRGSSFMVLQESAYFYEAYRRGEDVDLESPRPYRDYIIWLQQQDLSKAEAFWRGRLKGFVAPTAFGAVEERGRSDEAEYEAQRSRLTQTQTAELESFARRQRLTLNTVVQGAWAILLSRYSGERDVAFGTTISTRPPELPGADSMVGLFINTLPVRVQVEPDALLLPWLKQLQAQQVEMRQYQSTPLVLVQGWSEVPGGQPLFESLLVFENYRADDLKIEQARSIKIGGGRSIERTSYAITVAVEPGSELTLNILYDRTRFGDAEITRMLAHLQSLLEAILTNQESRLGDLNLLTEAERRQLAEWNDTSVPLPPPDCIHHLFSRQARSSPLNTALVFNDTSFSYSQLNLRANSLAHFLLASGISPETPVAIFLPRHPDLIVSLLAVLKAGAAYLPLDPAYPMRRIAFMLDDSRAPFVLTHQSLLHLLPPDKAKPICIDSLALPSHPDSLLDPATSTSPDNLAYIIYTSGSTGKPKGVAIDHRSSVAFLHWASLAFSRQELSSVLASTSVCFDLSVFEIFAPLTTGGKVVLVENALELAKPQHRDDISLINTVPSAMAELMRVGADLGRAQTVNLAGEPLKRKLADQVYERGGVRKVVNLYGPTEYTTYTTMEVVEEGTSKEPTIGRPISNTQVYVLDPMQREAGIGVVGEIYVCGEGLARGYLNRAELTAERFVPDDKSGRAGARMYRTGDMGRYRRDGRIEYIGRVDEQVKVRGYRIELGEIEAALEGHEGVREVVVITREDKSGNKRLVAYFVAERESITTASQLRSFLQEKLPLQMIPSGFVQLDSLPMTPNGKLDRKALPEPDNLRPELDVAFVSPRTELERNIASIWQEVLQVEKVGLHDNFFDLGGHSLLMINIDRKLQERFGADSLLRDTTIVELFKHPTVSSLAKHLSREKDLSSPAEHKDQTSKLKEGRSRLQQQRERIRQAFKD